MLRRKVSSLAALFVSLVASGPAIAQDATVPPSAPPPAAEPEPPAPGGVIVGAQPAAAPAAGQEEPTEEILVTGTRIRRKDLTTPAPVTVISRDQIQASGKVTIGDFLQSLPEQGNAINTSVNNGGDGATRVALRGLGAARTLVLLNGRRFVPGGTGADSSVDLNSIPTAAVERVEILKDGASAIYGSDAMGGVVNLITKKRWSGTEATAFGGTSSRGDGQILDLGFTTGSTSDRGSFIFSAGFQRQYDVNAGERDFSKIPAGFDAIDGQYTAGSGTIPAGRFVLSPDERGDPDLGNALYADLIRSAPASTSSFIRDPSGGPADSVSGWRPFRGTGLDFEGGDGYNFQPDNYLVTPLQRIQVFAIGDTRLGGAARGFFEASYVNRRSDQLLAPEPLLTDSEEVTVSAQNFYNPFGRDFTAVRRRLLEFDNRKFKQDLDTFRVVGGLDGSLAEGMGPLSTWSWEVALNYGRTQGVETKEGLLRLPRLQDALGPSFLDPADNTVKCGTPGNVIEGCVPLNLFGGPGTITPPMTEPLTYVGTRRGFNQVVGGGANLSGELPLTLMTERPVGLAVGYEYSRLSGADIPDPITAAGETSGNKEELTEGEYDVHAGYAELSIPILSGLPFAQDLEATAAARVFDYSTFGGDWTYKLGGRWRIVPDFTIRGTYSTAFRAPAIGDLFLGQQDNFAPLRDPCRGAQLGQPGYIDPGSTLGQACGGDVSTGGNANNLDDQTQLRSQVGGNPELQPETADIFTIGVVIEPRWVKNLSVTLDYYDIDIQDPISQIGEAVILNGCYLGGNQGFCNLIRRDPGSRRIVNIINTNQNVGSESAAGVDLAIRYALPTPYGRFGFVFDGTWLDHHDQTLADGSVIQGKETYDLHPADLFGGLGQVRPEFKFNTGVTWGWKGLGAGLSWRFLDGFRECGETYTYDDNRTPGDTSDDTYSGDFSGAGLCTGSAAVGRAQDGLPTFSRRVGSYHQFDAFVAYALRTRAGRTDIAVGMNNLFDQTPSTIYNGFLAQSDPTAYDFLGRFVYVRIAQSY